MSQLEGKEISYAQLHQYIHTPETGQLGLVLKSTPDPVNKAVKMVVRDGLVVVTAPHIKTKKPFEILVPLSGFTHLVVAGQ